MKMVSKVRKIEFTREKLYPLGNEAIKVLNDRMDEIEKQRALDEEKEKVRIVLTFLQVNSKKIYTILKSMDVEKILEDFVLLLKDDDEED